MAYVQAACQALLVTVFVASAVGKASSRAARSGFVESVRALRLVPERLLAIAAGGVVVAELGTAVLLVLPWTVPVGLNAAGVLLAIFTCSVLVTLRRGITAVCRCFGRSELPLGRRHLVRNGLLIAVVVSAAWSSMTATAWPHPAGLIVAVLAGLIGAALLIHFDELVELFTETATVRSPERRST